MHHEGPISIIWIILTRRFYFYSLKKIKYLKISTPIRVRIPPKPVICMDSIQGTVGLTCDLWVRIPPLSTERQRPVGSNPTWKSKLSGFESHLWVQRGKGARRNPANLIECWKLRREILYINQWRRKFWHSITLLPHRHTPVAACSIGRPLFTRPTHVTGLFGWLDCSGSFVWLKIRGSPCAPLLNHRRARMSTNSSPFIISRMSINSSPLKVSPIDRGRRVVEKTFRRVCAPCFVVVIN